MNLLNRTSIRRDVGVATAVVSLWIPLACSPLSTPLVISEDCAEDDVDAAVINTAGVYRYSGGGIRGQNGPTFQMSGTITFEQEGGMVRVADTTYDGGGQRPLESEFAELSGNRLGLLLTPQNGDTDYRAAVKFVFTEDGNQFCVEFTDTNTDNGPPGSFSGTREAG